MTTFDAVPAAVWNVGATPAPFDVRTWPAVAPATELRTPVPLLSTTPAPRGVSVIAPAETVSPFDAVSRLLTPSVPVIVLVPAIVMPPAVVLMFPPAAIVLVAVSVPVTSRPFAETATRPVPFGTSWMPTFRSEAPRAAICTGLPFAAPRSLIWFAALLPKSPNPAAVTSPVAAVIVSFTGLPTVKSPTD